MDNSYCKCGKRSSPYLWDISNCCNYYFQIYDDNFLNFFFKKDHKTFYISKSGSIFMMNYDLFKNIYNLNIKIDESNARKVLESFLNNLCFE